MTTFKHVWTLPEVMELADRLIGYGINSENHVDILALKTDALAAGRILAHLLLNQQISATITLGRPPTRN